MPKQLTDYCWREWIHLRPLTQAIKTRRYRRIDRRHLAEVPCCPKLSTLRRAMRWQQVMVVIAYNDSEVIRYQIELVRQNLPHVLHTVVDNSSDLQAAAKIKEDCRIQGIPYARISTNPWSGKNPSRSHGFAMNWTWRHLLLPARPRQFGFVDHDLFPTGSSDPFQHLESCCCYGDKRWAGSRWFLWAGFCFFDFHYTVNMPLDFGLDWFIGLDTGGANWEVIYKHMMSDEIKDRHIRQVPVWPQVPLKDAYFEWRDDWLHEVGLDGNPDLKSAKRRELVLLLESRARAKQCADTSRLLAW